MHFKNLLILMKDDYSWAITNKNKMFEVENVGALTITGVFFLLQNSSELTLCNRDSTKCSLRCEGRKGWLLLIGFMRHV